MKMKESGVSGQGQRFVAHFADWKKPRASTSAAIPARQRPAPIHLSPVGRPTRGKIPSVR
jgi:hypothetical protein